MRWCCRQTPPCASATRSAAPDRPARGARGSAVAAPTAAAAVAAAGRLLDKAFEIRLDALEFGPVDNSGLGRTNGPSAPLVASHCSPVGPLRPASVRRPCSRVVPTAALMLRTGRERPHER